MAFSHELLIVPMRLDGDLVHLERHRGGGRDLDPGGNRGRSCWSRLLGCPRNRHRQRHVPRCRQLRGSLRHLWVRSRQSG